VDEVEHRKMRAERGWIADPPPAPPTPYRPGQDTKWYLMMGARRLLTEKIARDRASAQDLTARYADLKERDRSYLTEKKGSAE